MKPAPPVIRTRTGLYGRRPSSSRELQPGVVAEHEAGRLGMADRAADLHFLAQQGVDDPPTIVDRAVRPDHRVLDVGTDDLAIVIYGREGPDEAVNDPCPKADDRRATDD